MTRHVAQIREGSGTYRCELKFNQSIRRNDHAFESLWAELLSSVSIHFKVGAEEEFFGYYGMEFSIVIKEPQHGFAIVM